MRSPVAVGVAFDLDWDGGGDGAAEDVAVGCEFELWSDLDSRGWAGELLDGESVGGVGVRVHG